MRWVRTPAGARGVAMASGKAWSPAVFASTSFEPIKASPKEFAAKVEERGARAQIVSPGQIYELG